MLKKNTRKRLLAGALATVMMLTMCPSWALADDEDIALLPANEEIAVPVDDSIPAADTTKTPADPTPSEPEAKPAEGQDPAPAPSNGGANGGTDSTESGTSTNPTIPEGSGNISQKNDVVSNPPENEISTQALQFVFPWDKPKENIKYFVLLPKRGRPHNGASQGPDNYLPSSLSDGGVDGCDNISGYIGGDLTPLGKKMADENRTGNELTNGYTKIDDVGFGAEYLVLPEDLGFFNEDYWKEDGTYTGHGDPFTSLGTDFNGKDIEIVWYTIKHLDDGYHIDGYVKNVAINVTYHSNFGEDKTFNHGTKTGTYYEARSYAETELPDRANYKFVGWYTDMDCTEAYEPATLMTSLDLYAKWEPTEYNVIYKVDGVETKSTKHAFNTPVQIEAEPTKTGHTFSGWSSKNVTLSGTDFTMPAKDVVIEGTFTANEYTVTYKVDGVETKSTKHAFNTPVQIEPKPTQTGKTFSGWSSTDVTLGDTSFTMPAKNVTIRGFFTQNTHQYTINKHFYDEKGAEIAELASKATASGAENALIADLYKNDAVNQTVSGKNYVYVPGLTTPKDGTLTKDVTIDLHYYLNVEGGNDIPDAWEHRLTFKVVNGEWNDGGNADIVTYVQFKDQTTGKPFKDEAVVVPVTRIPAVGDKPNSGYHAGAWDTSPYDNYKVQKDTVFTYTYAKNSSGGSSGGSHHRKPTVTIPDKVPTGLNGNDHYAYIVGYPDKTVRPQNGITRAEVATIFFRLLTDETRNANSTKSNSYSDVAAGAWYNHAVSTLSAMGIVKGDSDGKFNPNAPITRAEFAAIAARFDDKANSTTADFSDIVSHWAKNEISAASNNGWITGYPDGTFRPDNKITRAEAMTLVNRVLKRLPETAEDLHDDMIKWSDNSDASQWFYLAVQEATNSHYYQTKENKFEKWSELRDTRDWTELEK